MKISKHASVERKSNCNHYNARDDGRSKKFGGWKRKIGMRNRNRKSVLVFFVGKNLRGRRSPVPLVLEVEMSGCIS